MFTVKKKRNNSRDKRNLKSINFEKYVENKDV